MTGARLSAALAEDGQRSHVCVMIRIDKWAVCDTIVGDGGRVMHEESRHCRCWTLLEMKWLC
jgi:hypothetical protein